MNGAVYDIGDVKSASVDSADVVIIGSGAAGATAARVLTEAGVDVAILEEGPYVRTEELRSDVYSGFKRVWRDAGFQVAEGRAFTPILQGRCVGGTTAINGAIIHRMPEAIFATWQRDYGVEPRAQLRRAVDHLGSARRRAQRGARAGRRAGQQQPLDAHRLRTPRHPRQSHSPQRARLPRLRPLQPGLPHRAAPEHERLLRASGGGRRRPAVRHVSRGAHDHPRRPRHRRARPLRGSRHGKARPQPHAARTPRRPARCECHPDAAVFGARTASAAAPAAWASGCKRIRAPPSWECSTIPCACGSAPPRVTRAFTTGTSA